MYDFAHLGSNITTSYNYLFLIVGTLRRLITSLLLIIILALE